MPCRRGSGARSLLRLDRRSLSWGLYGCTVCVTTLSSFCMFGSSTSIHFIFLPPSLASSLVHSWLSLSLSLPHTYSRPVMPLQPGYGILDQKVVGTSRAVEQRDPSFRPILSHCARLQGSDSVQTRRAVRPARRPWTSEGAALNATLAPGHGLKHGQSDPAEREFIIVAHSSIPISRFREVQPRWPEAALQPRPDARARASAVGALRTMHEAEPAPGAPFSPSATVATRRADDLLPLGSPRSQRRASPRRESERVRLGERADMKRPAATLTPLPVVPSTRGSPPWSASPQRGDAARAKQPPASPERPSSSVVATSAATTSPTDAKASADRERSSHKRRPAPPALRPFSTVQPSPYRQLLQRKRGGGSGMQKEAERAAGLVRAEGFLRG